MEEETNPLEDLMNMLDPKGPIHLRLAGLALAGLAGFFVSELVKSTFTKYVIEPRLDD